jgi:hypothetical protein
MTKPRTPGSTKPSPADNPDWIWGAQAIGAHIGRSPDQVYYLFSLGKFGTAVWKMGAKNLVGSREGLRQLPKILASAE